MKRYQTLVLTFSISMFFIINFSGRLNAQTQNKPPSIDIFAVLRSPELALVLTIISMILGIWGRQDIVRLIWRLRPDLSYILKAQDLLESTIYNDSDLSNRSLYKKINSDIKSFIKIKDSKDTGLNIVEISRIYIEHKFLYKKIQEEIQISPTIKILKQRKVQAEQERDEAQYRNNFHKVSKLKNKIRKDEIMIQEESDKEFRKLISKKIMENEYKIISVANCFEIKDKDEEIITYLQTYHDLERLDPSKNVEFYCSVHIKNGFVSPLYLMTGPLRYFHEDWPKIIKQYKASVGSSHRRSRDENLQKLISSIFTTWIGWGPSIPICNCEKWQENIAIQYGFGDENNSIPVLLSGENEQTEFVNKFFKDNFVKNAEITAKLTLLSNSGRIAEAQNDLCQEARPEIVLTKIEKDDGRTNLDRVSYYSAYMWILFGVTDQQSLESGKFKNKIRQGETNYDEDESIFYDMLPFFDHINVGDAALYNTQKDNFTFKVLNSLKTAHKLATAHKLVEDGNIRFVYLCAIDDCNCSDARNQRISLLRDISPQGELIKDVLKQLITGQEDREDLEKWILLDKGGLLPASHLPKMINNLNLHMKKLE